MVGKNIPKKEAIGAKEYPIEFYIKRTVIAIIGLVLLSAAFLFFARKFGFFKIGFQLENILFYIGCIFALFVFFSQIKQLGEYVNSSRKDKKGQAQETKAIERNEAEKIEPGKKAEPLIKKEQKNEIKKSAIIKPLKLDSQISAYDTELDILYKLVEQEGTIKISRLSKYFGMDRKKIMDLTQILEDNKMVEVHYPPIGEAEVKKVKQDESENDKK